MAERTVVKSRDTSRLCCAIRCRKSCGKSNSTYKYIGRGGFISASRFLQNKFAIFANIRTELLVLQNCMCVCFCVHLS